ncbi:MAG: hypothetical protein N3I35_13840 [Clostridia bacterium]|nr:hypothetical protein [Clostridia bacterium]
MSDEIKRVSYFERQFLRAKEFVDEQKYHTRLHREHNKRLHTTGVVISGFEVTPNTLDPNDKTKVLVLGGMALDCEGREIFLFETCPLPMPGNVNMVDIYVYYSEEPAEPSNDPGVAGNHTRIVEKPCFAVSPRDKVPAGAIYIAQVKLKDGMVEGSGSITDKRTVVVSTIGNNSIDEVMLRNNSVSTRTIRDNAVDSNKLRSDAVNDTNRAVGTDHIKNNAVTSDKLRSDGANDANRAVGTNHIRNNAVTAAKLQSDTSIDTNRAVGTDHIKNNSVTYEKLRHDSSVDVYRAVGTDHIRDGAVTYEKVDWNIKNLLLGGYIAVNSDGTILSNSYHNVTSVYRLRKGEYQINWTKPVSPFVHFSYPYGDYRVNILGTSSVTTVIVSNSAGVNVDGSFCIMAAPL